MKKTVFFLIITLLSFSSSYSQNTDFRELFLQAESYFLFEEFNEALPLYLRIHRQFPDNDNINYKIGVCLLNNPYEKNKSIRYLEEAAENINPKFKENSFRETGAPLEVLYYLGTAYRINNQLSKAREYFNLFLVRLDPEIYDVELVERQIATVDAAESLMKKPIDIDSENLGSKINTRFADINPVVSGDETKMAFISRLQFYDAIFYTEKVNGEWLAPRNIVPELGVDGDVYPTCLSYNGTEMYIYRNDEFDGNLYVTKLINGKWTPLRKLNENINTKYWESHASVSRDGKTLYFSSNRKGSFGGLDIFRSERLPNGEWGEATNLGNVINSPYNDDNPFITEDGQKIFFSSYGHYNMGGYDIFMSRKNADGSWAKPVNIGYSINSTDDDQFFNPVKNGQAAYYSRFDQSGNGRHDIHRITIYSPDNPRMFAIEGLLDYMGVKVDSSEVKISLVEKGSADTLSTINPNRDGRFKFKAPEGQYQLVFDSDKFHSKIEELELSRNVTGPSGLIFATPIILSAVPTITDQREEEELLKILSDSLIYAKEGEPVEIRFRASKDATVQVNALNQGQNYFSESVEAGRREQKVEFDPRPGENTVVLTLTDDKGNLIQKQLRIMDPEKPLTEIDTREVPGDGRAGSNLLPGQTPGAGTSGTGSGPAAVLSPGAGGLTQAELFRDLLLGAATGSLLDYLMGLDPEEEGIENKDELILHLFNESENQEFTDGDVDRLITSVDELYALEKLIGNLQENSDENLKNYLEELDPEKSQIQNRKELIDNLYSNTDKGKYSPSDVTKALAKTQNYRDIEKLIRDLSAFANGNLKETLLGIDPENQGIESFGELITHLRDKAPDNGYTNTDINQMLADYFASTNAIRLFERLIVLSEGDTRAFLESIDRGEIVDMGRSELYRYLLRESDREKDITTDLIDVMLRAEEIPTSQILRIILKNASDELKEVLKEMEADTPWSHELYRYLLRESENNRALEEEEVVDHFRHYVEYIDLYEFLDYLITNSDGALRDILLDLNLREMGITTIPELIQYLLSLEDMSEEIVYQTVSDGMTRFYVEKMLDELNRLSVDYSGLNKALTDVNLGQTPLYNLRDLIEYLTPLKESYGFTSGQLSEVIEKYLQGDLPFEEKTIDEFEPSEKDHGKSGRGARLTLLILLAEGLVILFLILFERRRKKKEDRT